MAKFTPRTRSDSGYDLSPSATTLRILEVIESYGKHEKSHSNADQTGWLGRTTFGPIVEKHVRSGTIIPMVLPSFPWKSINRVDKVLGTDPDLGEELALARINDLCQSVQQVYTPGAMVVIATDGLCYNDILGIPDEDAWDYGSAIRSLAAKRGYSCIKFMRIMNLLGLYTDSEISKHDYLNLCSSARKQLALRYGDPSFDADMFLKTDEDYMRTYLGYSKFLTKDLAYSSVMASLPSRKMYKAKVKAIGKEMIAGGVAYAKLIREVYPEHVRLSIHPSSGATKLSIPLIPQPSGFSMSPWNCAIAVSTKGTFRTSHVSDLRDSHDLVQKDGRDYCFREKSPLYRWDAEVEMEHHYGGVLVIRDKYDGKVELDQADRKRLVALAILQGRVELQGF
ncbi:Pyoverdine biosynthesis [Neofusicoccum parvum]|uniref:Pyoverdine biosynthesis n=1 Tax=Neofusicoccum parvum TaxID=310453 RepID=A0ACB5RT44_9PEZI|nr:Pyoverdine biosynthesis [Neofusicoccum parvum]